MSEVTKGLNRLEDQLRQRIAELERDVEGYGEAYSRMMRDRDAEVAKLEAENKRLKEEYAAEWAQNAGSLRNAERYRWLRDNGASKTAVSTNTIRAPSIWLETIGQNQFLTGKYLDAAIDAAMQEGE